MSKFKKNKPICSVDTGIYQAEFYYDEKRIDGTYLDLRGKYLPDEKRKPKHDVFRLKLDGRCFTYGYLLAAVTQDRESEIKAFCSMLWVIISGIYRDESFCGDIIAAVNKYTEKLLEKAESEAENTTPEQIKTDEVLFDSIIEDNNNNDNK
jgi:hypothetical protein